MSEVSIVVAPRERLSCLPASLKSLFASIGPEVPVIVVEGASPPHVRARLERLRGERPFEWVAKDYMLIPQEARNLGFERVQTPYVIFTDNDIFYEQGWLETYLGHAKVQQSDVVAPLTCIGPPAATKIHHAGGTLLLHPSETGKPLIGSLHRLANQPVAAAWDPETEVPIEADIVEFHCFLARSDYIRGIGLLDERMISREHLDFALRAKFHGAKVTFERGAVITYMALAQFSPEDMEYFSFRWCDQLAIQSFDAFCGTWDIQIDRNRALNKWIRFHRIRAYSTLHRAELEAMGQQKFFHDFMLPRETAIKDRAFAARPAGLTPHFPKAPAVEQARAFVRDLAARTAAQSDGRLAEMAGAD